MIAPKPSRFKVLAFGMGLDSCAILTRWLDEPDSRDFDLEQLIVLTAMTGNEYDSTRQLMEQHILPRMREQSVRFVQIARASQEGGYVVLDDSREPQRMIMRGPWALQDELAGSGTVPQAAGGRLCSYRAKGEVLDWWLADHFPDRPYVHFTGYAAEEQSRADRADAAIKDLRIARYPLIEWGWSRERCDEMLLARYGVRFERSACGYCPFSATKRGVFDVMRRWREEPQVAATALTLEYGALALNEKQMLYADRSARDLARDHGVDEGVALHEQMLADSEWALIEVRRIYFQGKAGPQAKGPAWRSVRTRATGTRAQTVRWLRRCARARGAELRVDRHGIARVHTINPASTYPTLQRYLVAAPKLAIDKQRPRFDERWRELGAARRGKSTSPTPEGPPLVFRGEARDRYP